MTKMNSYKVFTLLNNTFLSIILILTGYPFVYIVAKSFSGAQAIMSGKVFLWPVDFNLLTYVTVLQKDLFWINYKNTIVYTVTGTILSLALTTLIAYPLSKKKLLGKNVILKFITFTMFFSGGIIPTYLVVTSLQFTRNTIWGVILPNAISAYYVLIMKSFFEGIPESIEEAASIDGMDTLGILIKIVFPLSKPILATMTMFYAVLIWNNWFTPFLFLREKRKMPVNMFLRDILFAAGFSMENSRDLTQSDLNQISMNLKSVTVVLVMLPMLAAYPFIQKYFAKGVMIGSIKG